jgi:hypothetical protein
VNDPLSAQPNGTLTYRLRGRSAADGGRYRQAAGGRAGNSAQALSGSAATNRSPGAQTGVGDTAALTVGAGALTSVFEMYGGMQEGFTMSSGIDTVIFYWMGAFLTGLFVAAVALLS